MNPETDVLAQLVDALRAEGHTVEFGPIVFCDTCGYRECVCEIRKTHTETCRYRRAMEMMIAVYICEHDRNVCAICDSCDCPAGFIFENREPPYTFRIDDKDPHE